METHSNFTFVETGTPTTRRGTAEGSTARSIIRSHAMQQVWEQRRLQRAQSHGHGKFEIVFESGKPTDAANTTRSAEPKAHPYERPCETRPTRGATRSGKKSLNQKLHTSTSEGVVYPPNTETGKKNSKFEALPNIEDESLRKSRSLLPGIRATKSRANLSGQVDRSFWHISPANPPSAIALCLMDPFDTCAISLGPKESRYMTHYFQALSWRLTLPKRTWLRYAIHDPGLLHGVLAIAAAHYSLATTRGLSDDALFHYGKTINHVQNCLKDPELRFSDGVIGAIGRMVICHLIFGNRDHFITHIRALDRCAAARGGLENLGMLGQLKYIVGCCVAGAAIIWWEDVPFQLRHPYGLLDYLAVDDVPDAEAHDPEWGAAFYELNERGFLSDKLLGITEAMVALNSVIVSRRSWDESQQRVFGEQCNKLSLRLIYLKEEEAVSDREMAPHDHMRECVRLAMHFYILAYQREAPLLSNFSIQILHQLRDSLVATDLETSWGGGQLGEVLLWVLIITASGCVRPQDRECAGAQLRKTALQLGVREWPKVKRICRRFLFVDSAIEWKAWPLWKDHGPRSLDGS